MFLGELTYASYKIQPQNKIFEILNFNRLPIVRKLDGRDFKQYIVCKLDIYVFAWFFYLLNQGLLFFIHPVWKNFYFYKHRKNRTGSVGIKPSHYNCKYFVRLSSTSCDFGNCRQKYLVRTFHD